MLGFVVLSPFCLLPVLLTLKNEGTGRSGITSAFIAMMMAITLFLFLPNTVLSVLGKQDAFKNVLPFLFIGALYFNYSIWREGKKSIYTPTNTLDLDLEEDKNTSNVENLVNNENETKALMTLKMLETNKKHLPDFLKIEKNTFSFAQLFPKPISPDEINEFEKVKNRVYLQMKYTIQALNNYIDFLNETVFLIMQNDKINGDDHTQFSSEINTSKNQIIQAKNLINYLKLKYFFWEKFIAEGHTVYGFPSHKLKAEALDYLKEHGAKKSFIRQTVFPFSIDLYIIKKSEKDITTQTKGNNKDDGSNLLYNFSVQNYGKLEYRVIYSGNFSDKNIKSFLSLNTELTASNCFSNEFLNFRS